MVIGFAIASILVSSLSSWLVQRQMMRQEKVATIAALQRFLRENSVRREGGGHGPLFSSRSLHVLVCCPGGRRHTIHVSNLGGAFGAVHANMCLCRIQPQFRHSHGE